MTPQFRAIERQLMASAPTESQTESTGGISLAKTIAMMKKSIEEDAAADIKEAKIAQAKAEADAANTRAELTKLQQQISKLQSDQLAQANQLNQLHNQELANMRKEAKEDLSESQDAVNILQKELAEEQAECASWQAKYEACDKMCTQYQTMLTQQKPATVVKSKAAPVKPMGAIVTFKRDELGQVISANLVPN